MTTAYKKLVVVGSLFSLLMSNAVWADEATLTQRIERLERTIQGQGLVALLGRVDQLQNEVQRLNGDNESLRHQIEILQTRQRELYIDLDERLQKQIATPVAVITTESVEPPTPTVPTIDLNTATTDNTSAVDNGEVAYQAALQTLRSDKYEQAVTALEKFPEDYPQSSYLPNAYYWQGEANYKLSNFDKAITAFNKVINDFPRSSKVAHATLKLGFSQNKSGQFDAAKTTLTSVITDYPNTSAARLAQGTLDRMKK